MKKTIIYFILIIFIGITTSSCKKKKKDPEEEAVYHNTLSYKYVVKSVRYLMRERYILKAYKAQKGEDMYIPDYVDTTRWNSEMQKLIVDARPKHISIHEARRRVDSLMEDKRIYGKWLFELQDE